MKVDELQDGGVVKARWGRAGREGPNWCAWQHVELRVQRNGRGKVVLIGLKGGRDWADYDPRHDLEKSSGLLINEDYYLEIDGLTKAV
jgi:hypothetical protein